MKQIEINDIVSIYSPYHDDFKEQLTRIADALEKIVDAVEENSSVDIQKEYMNKALEYMDYWNPNI